MRQTTSVRFAQLLCTSFALAMLASFIYSQSAHATTWATTTGNPDQWWYNPANWTGGTLPPANTTADISNGFNFSGDGVVFDPANDPNFNAAGNSDPRKADNPFDIGTGQLELANGTSAVSSKLTIDSGTIQISSTSSNGVIVGRQGNTNAAGTPPSVVGTLIQNGGNLLVKVGAFDVGQVNTTRGDGIYAYHGGTLEVATTTAAFDIRLATGTASNASPSTAQVAVYNDGPDGHFRGYGKYVMANGTGTVAVTEFHVDANTHGEIGTRPIQTQGAVTFNNNLTSGSGAKSSRLQLILDTAPTVDGGGIPESLALWDLYFGVTNGSGASGTLYNANNKTDGSPVIDPTDLSLTATGLGATTPPVLANLTDGSLISATFGSTQYTWAIHYNGTISYSDPNAETGVSVTWSAASTDKDIVLVGVSSVAVPEPASLVLMCLGCGAVGLVAARRRRSVA